MLKPNDLRLQSWNTSDLEAIKDLIDLINGKKTMNIVQIYHKVVTYEKWLKNYKISDCGYYAFGSDYQVYCWRYLKNPKKIREYDIRLIKMTAKVRALLTPEQIASVPLMEEQLRNEHKERIKAQVKEIKKAKRKRLTTQIQDLEAEVKALKNKCNDLNKLNQSLQERVNVLVYENSLLKN